MDPKPTPQPTPDQKPQEGRPMMHTYQSDLSLAMDTTDAKVVQELLQTAREKELRAAEQERVRHQRGWYTAGGLILILLAVGALGYGVWYYNHLTVPVAEQPQVGVFQSVDPVVMAERTIEETVAYLRTKENLPEGKPFLVPLVSDATTLTPASIEELLQYIHADASEPFIATLSLARLGVMNTGTNVVPFLVFSVPNPDLATKEFLIAEPNLLSMFAPALSIDLSRHAAEIGKGFVSSYMYNLPVRSVRSFAIDTNQETLLMYYGFATDHTIVVATNPSVLKAVYDTIIRQH